MTDPTDLNAQQLAYWNGSGAEMWVVRQQQMDNALAPVSRAVLAHAAVKPGEVVLDIGCGTGGTVLALADAVGPSGRVIGLDVSAPMIGLARSRAEGRANVSLVLGDAAAHPFEPGSADVLFSRFGVMFFGDPVGAFAHMRQAMKPGGRVAMAVWQPALANAWVRTPLHAVAGIVAIPEATDVGLPGQFAFGDANRVAQIMTDAGFSPPSFTPFTFPMPLGRSVDEAAQRASEFGASGRALGAQPEDVKAAAVAAIRAAFAPHANAEGFVALPGAVWLISATA